MKLIIRIFLGFLFLIVGITALVGINYNINRESIDTTIQIRDVETPLELMVEQVIGYDAMLTGAVHHSLLHVEKRDFSEFEKFKKYYDETGVKLDTLLKVDARVLLEKSKRTQELKDKVNGYLQKLDEVNLKLVDLETRAFEAMRKNDTETAYSLVVGEDYETYKDELRRLYLNWTAVEQNITSNLRKNIIENGERLNNYNLYFAGFIILFAMIISFLISFSISKSIKKLTNDIEEITKGNLDIQLRKSNITEIQVLTDSLNRILASLKLAILRTGLTKGEFGLGEAIKAKEEIEKRYDILIANMPQKIFFKDKNSVYISCNENYSKDLKIKSEEIVGKTDYDFYPKQLAKKYIADDKIVMESNKLKDIKEKYIQNGREVFVHTLKTPVIDKNGKVIGILGIFWELGKEEREKEEAEKKYEDLFNKSIDAIFIADSVTRQLIDCNEAAEELVGYSRDKILSMKADELHPKDKLRETMEGFKKQAEGKIKTIFSEVLTKDKKRIPVAISSTIVSIGNKDYLQGIFRNVTKEKELFGRGEIAGKREEITKGREEVVGKRETTATGREEIVGRREKIKVGEGREGIALGREKIAGRREETVKGREEMMGKREETAKGREEMMGKREEKTAGKEGIIKKLIKGRKAKNEKELKK